MSYALITGASKGIGRAIAIELAKSNYDLLLTARSADLLSSVADEIKKIYTIQVHVIALDLSEGNAPKKLYDWCVENRYPVSILVNNAGYGISGLFVESTLEKNINLIQLNITALTQLCQLFLPILKQQPAAHILNIASTASYQAIPHLSVYAASKSYVQSFSRGIAEELLKTTVSVTCISPGPTDTDWATTASVPPKALKLATKLNMTPERVANIAVKAMLARKTEVIPGFINNVGAFMAWLLPKKLVERSTGNLYK